MYYVNLLSASVLDRLCIAGDISYHRINELQKQPLPVLALCLSRFRILLTQEEIQYRSIENDSWRN